MQKAFAGDGARASHRESALGPLSSSSIVLTRLHIDLASTSTDRTPPYDVHASRPGTRRERLPHRHALSHIRPLQQPPTGLGPCTRSVRPLGRVGQLQDVQLLSVPRASWPSVQGELLDSLNALPGVLRVDVQEKPRTRAKRGGDEL
ncbi:hypothetical protein BN946_scf184940.g68 [Trametes cinnabarina]|uniref:Uncharacterized protein n=1 Tax=Pycnoporus cinnabarinus TaxID=5643 RepID=A0A060SCI8_PYCCI|nr:hypothetical protein BN946_scf184940.g68 [Trametes cinnabarina]